MDQGVGHEIKRLREERGWSQARLAVEAEMSVSGVSMIENGQRNLTTTTLAKLARAFGLEIADLFPKAPAPQQLELEEQRGAGEKQGVSVSKAVSEYIFNRVERHEREYEDPNSAYFRDTTAATLWLAQLNEELEDYCSWVEGFVDTLFPSEEFASLLMNFVNLAFPAGSFGMLIYRVEERIAAMQGQPDELAQRRAETAKANAAAGQRRVEELSERLKAG